jgi:hypothetical protein
MNNPFDITVAPIGEPATIVSGVFTQWRKALAFSPTDYNVSYSGAPFDGAAGGHTFTFAGTLTGQEAQFTLTGATTAGWHAHEYRWRLLLTRKSDSETVELETGSWRVFKTTDDRRTHAEVMLTKIESLLANRADDDVSSYSIAGRSLDRIPLPELLQWRDHYRAEIAAGGGSVTITGPSKNKVLIRFGEL